MKKRELLVSRSSLLSAKVRLLSHSQVGLELLVHLFDDSLSLGQSDGHLVYLILKRASQQKSSLFKTDLGSTKLAREREQISC